jgi:hypothetical protein
MDARRFEALLDAYGQEPRRWPAAERAAAEAFARTPAGHAALAGVIGLDEWLDAAPAMQPSAALRERVLEGAPRPGPWTSFAAWLGPARTWAPGAGLGRRRAGGGVVRSDFVRTSTDASAEMLLAEAGPYDEALMLESTP